jgi:hypothetical protein
VLLALAHQSGLPAGAGVPWGGELSDLLREEVTDGLEAEGDEGLADVFRLAITLDAEQSLHGAAPFCVGLVGLWQEPLHHAGAASSIFN